MANENVPIQQSRWVLARSLRESTFLYDVFLGMINASGYALRIERENEESLRRVSLFTIPLYDEINSRMCYMTVSWVFETDKTHGGYTFDYTSGRKNASGYYDQTNPGVVNPEVYLQQFLTQARNKLKSILKNDKVPDPKDDVGTTKQFYIDVLTGKTFSVKHAGNTEGTNLKYELTEDEEKLVIEKLARPFRAPISNEEMKIEQIKHYRKSEKRRQNERSFVDDTEEPKVNLF